MIELEKADSEIAADLEPPLVTFSWEPRVMRWVKPEVVSKLCYISTKTQSLSGLGLTISRSVTQVPSTVLRIRRARAFVVGDLQFVVYVGVGFG